jgi:hypothetical protein
MCFLVSRWSTKIWLLHLCSTRVLWCILAMPQHVWGTKINPLWLTGSWHLHQNIIKLYQIPLLNHPFQYQIHLKNSKYHIHPGVVVLSPPTVASQSPVLFTALRACEAIDHLRGIGQEQQSHALRIQTTWKETRLIRRRTGIFPGKLGLISMGDLQDPYFMGMFPEI